jgi:hypothetical protein
MTTKPSQPAAPASRLIDQRIRALGDWRGETLARLRALILAADPAMIEEIKWVKPTNPLGVPVWSHAGIVCTGETYAKVVKLTFAKGAALPDPANLFNASLAGGTRRAIDIREDEKVDARAFKALVKAAVAHNAGTAKPTKPRASEPKPAARAAKPVKLLSGGNPQIAKGDGDAPVQAYIAAMPGWKREVGRQLDALIVRSAPKAQKAVKWNSPFYGIEGQGWFLSFHVFTRYIKVAFFRGTSLRPLPPVASKDPEARYFHIHEGDTLDETQLAKWVKQAAALPGYLDPRS